MSEKVTETEAQREVDTPEEEVIHNTDRSGRLRDEKGHFLPSDVGKCKHDKKLSKEKKDDPNVVKIKIVKEKKPKMPRNIIGKLNEFKERNASRFIESVISNEPSKIEIDGKIYFSEKVAKKMWDEMKTAQKNEIETIKCMDEMKKNLETLLDASRGMLKQITDSSFKYRMWKSLAIGLLTGFVLGFAINMAKVYVAELDRNQPHAELRPSAAR